jgi:hypothetical protein
MSYTQEAKNLYDTFQDAMGNWNRVPFERLTNKEINAWQTATGLTLRLKDEIEAAMDEIEDIRCRLESLREKLDNLKD